MKLTMLERKIRGFGIAKRIPVLILLLSMGCGLTGVSVKDVPDKIAGHDGATMVLIPSGTFVMGSHHKGGDKDEGPLHTVYLGAYCIDVY